MNVIDLTEELQGHREESLKPIGIDHSVDVVDLLDDESSSCDDGHALVLDYDLHGSHPSVNQTAETYVKQSKGRFEQDTALAKRMDKEKKKSTDTSPQLDTRHANEVIDICSSDESSDEAVGTGMPIFLTSRPAKIGTATSTTKCFDRKPHPGKAIHPESEKATDCQPLFNGAGALQGVSRRRLKRKRTKDIDGLATRDSSGMNETASRRDRVAFVGNDADTDMKVGASCSLHHPMLSRNVSEGKPIGGIDSNRTSSVTGPCKHPQGDVIRSRKSKITQTGIAGLADMDVSRPEHCNFCRVLDQRQSQLNGKISHLPVTEEASKGVSKVRHRKRQRNRKRLRIAKVEVSAIQNALIISGDGLGSNSACLKSSQLDRKGQPKDGEATLITPFLSELGVLHEPGFEQFSCLNSDVGNQIHPRRWKIVNQSTEAKTESTSEQPSIEICLRSAIIQEKLGDEAPTLKTNHLAQPCEKPNQAPWIEKSSDDVIDTIRAISVTESESNSLRTSPLYVQSSMGSPVIQLEKNLDFVEPTKPKKEAAKKSSAAESFHSHEYKSLDGVAEKSALLRQRPAMNRCIGVESMGQHNTGAKSRIHALAMPFKLGLGGTDSSPFDSPLSKQTVIPLSTGLDKSRHGKRGMLNEETRDGKATPQLSAEPNFILIDDSSDDEPTVARRTFPSHVKNPNGNGFHKEDVHQQRLPDKRFRPHADFNFDKSMKEALDEQEGLLRQAAASLHLHEEFLRTMHRQTSPLFCPTFTRPVEPAKLHQDHWKWQCVYARLGLPLHASEAIVKKQYRKHALQYHPDKCRLHDASSRFQAVTEAYNKIRQLV